MIFSDYTLTIKHHLDNKINEENEEKLLLCGNH